MTRATCAGWGQIYRQFGADPAKANETRTVDAFRTKCLRELTKSKPRGRSPSGASAMGDVHRGPGARRRGRGGGLAAGDGRGGTKRREQKCPGVARTDQGLALGEQPGRLARGGD